MLSSDLKNLHLHYKSSQATQITEENKTKQMDGMVVILTTSLLSLSLSVCVCYVTNIDFFGCGGGDYIHVR